MTKTPLSLLSLQKLSALLLVACACGLAALVVPSVGTADPVDSAILTVDSTANQADEDPGDEVCETTLGTCTLRAAIEESNELITPDKIIFAASFNGEPGDTIALTAPLPAIEDALTIEGGPVGACTGTAAGTCIDVDGPSSGSALTVDGEDVTISGLSIALSGSATGIDAASEASTIRGVSISGGAVGIHTGGEETGSNDIDLNRIEGTSGPGILIENDRNIVTGNVVVDAGAAGIRVHSSGGIAADENVIGGQGFVPLAEPGENTISDSAGPAVEIKTVEASGGRPTANRVLRNRGTGNTGLFIDLVPIEPLTEHDGPNGGILPPEIGSATKTSVSGTSEPENIVRVYRKASSASGEIQSFLGFAQADEDGNWSLTYASAIPGGTAIAANQTPEEDELGSSELAFATTPSDPPPPSCATDASLCPPSQSNQQNPPPTPQPKPKPKPLKCKKGFKKKTVKGKPRCVRVKKKAKHH